jgi:Protein of unknown function (DUF3320)
MGWRIHRIWSTEWFHDRENAIAGVLRSVEQAQQEPMDHPMYAPPAKPAPPPPNRSSAGKTSRAPEVPRKYKPGVPYALFQPRLGLSREHLLEASFSVTLAGTISELVRTEGPIHHDLLVDRLKELHGVARAGSNVQSNIERALSFAQQRGGVTADSKSRSISFRARSWDHSACLQTPSGSQLSRLLQRKSRSRFYISLRISLGCSRNPCRRLLRGFSASTDCAPRAPHSSTPLSKNWLLDCSSDAAAVSSIWHNSLIMPDECIQPKPVPALRTGSRAAELRAELVRVALAWQDYSGVAPHITTAISELDAALLVGMNEDEYCADGALRTAVTKGKDFTCRGVRYQVTANRPSGKKAPQ